MVLVRASLLVASHCYCVFLSHLGRTSSVILFKEHGTEQAVSVFVTYEGIQEMEIHWSEIGSLGRLVDYVPAVNPATLHAWLAVRSSVISAPLAVVQLLGANDV